MSDENTGASATQTPPPATPSDKAPHTMTSTEPPKKESALASESDPKGNDTANLTAPAQEKADEAAAKETAEKPAESPDVEMKDASEPAPATGEAEKPESAQHDETNPSPMVDNSVTPSDKSKGRRKSAASSDTKGKKLNRKASKAKILHLDAKPGDHFFVKLKGFPQWPAIICDEDMLPQALIKSRPVTAVRVDGTYREDYADGGKRVHDRTYPVMYLHTNEFGWVPNSDLNDLDPETVMEVKMDKMRKDLQAAHKLASESHSLDYYKDVLDKYQKDLLQQQKAKEPKAQATPAKKSKKAKAEAGEDEDVDMADDDAEEDEGKQKKSKKRKAEGSAETPQRSDSVKKPKIKLTLNSTPKTANSPGSALKSSKAQSQSKTPKPKSRKSVSEVEEKSPQDEDMASKEPEFSPEERYQRRKKEALFLRHKLQRGLLTRDQEPKEDEMGAMSDFLSKLESVPDLEASIIRETKINKVLKAILKLDTIPKEEEFRFKPRSQALLEKWNEILAVDEPAASAPATAGATEPAKAVNGTAAKASDAKGEPEAKAETNGVKEQSAASAEPPKPEESSAEGTKAPEAVEAST